MNIAYAGNKKVFKGILLSLLSMVKHSSDALNVYILTMDLRDMNSEYVPISGKECSILEAVVKNKNPESKVILLDATSIYFNSLSNNRNNDTKYTPYSMIKLFLDEVAGIPDKLIYLDCDTLMLQDLKQVDNLNIDDYELAAVKDATIDQFNSGVLFLNMKLIKQTGLFRNCRNLIATKKMKKPDQTALNLKAISVLMLEDVFNDQAKVRKNTVIRHFCSGVKFPVPTPFRVKSWEVEKIYKTFNCHDFDDIFVQYEILNKKFSLEESIMPKTAE